MQFIPMLLILFLALFLRQGAVEARRPPADTSIRILTEDLPPLAYLDHSTGRLVGETARRVQAGMRSAGIVAPVEVLPWARALEMTRTRPNTFLFNLARIPERERQFRWVCRTAQKRIGVFRLRKRADIHIGSIDDLRKHRVEVLNQNVAHLTLLSKGLESRYINALPNHEKLIDLLFAGRAELWVRTYLGTDDLDAQIKAAGHDPRAVVKAWDLDGGTIDLYLATNLTTSDSLVERVRRALRDVR